ncbi:hypothetical protein JW977_01630 [Candidatus Falkowbacteria bacterium]|nr:hypothetical protein [Candidatus Falkowbacteria bacterium]
MEKQNNQSSAILISLGFLLRKAFLKLKEAGGNLLLSVFFIVCLIFVLFFFLGILYYSIISIKIVQTNYLFTFRLIWQIIFYLATYALGVIAQVLIIKSLVSPKEKFNVIISSLKTYFLNFLCLSIFINIIFLVCYLPFYGGIFLLLFESQVLGACSIIISLILNLLAVIFLIMSPFILIEKNKWFIEAVKESFKIASNNFWDIVIKLVIICISLVLLLNISTLLCIILPTLGAIISIILFIPVILLVFSYLFAFYQYLK